jgi:hypothetical protein
MLAPSMSDIRAQRDDARARWATHPGSASLQQLQAAHASIASVAVEISGSTLDARKRAIVYYALYEESGGNFMFPLVASHGSLWGVTHTSRIDRQLRRALPLSRHGRIDRWLAALDDVRDVNRRVFREIYTTFWFTRAYGHHPAAATLVKPEVLALYNRAHAAVAEHRLLPYEARRSIYYDVFVHEQNDIVDPGIQAAAEACGTPGLVRVLKHVRPRFAYFPRGERLYFTDFTDVEQRNREGLRACDFAEEVGAARVLEAMAAYSA